MTKSKESEQVIKIRQAKGSLWVMKPYRGQNKARSTVPNSRSTKRRNKSTMSDRYNGSLLKHLLKSIWWDIKLHRRRNKQQTVLPTEWPCNCGGCGENGVLVGYILHKQSMLYSEPQQPSCILTLTLLSLLARLLFFFKCIWRWVSITIQVRFDSGIFSAGKNWTQSFLQSCSD